MLLLLIASALFFCSLKVFKCLMNPYVIITFFANIALCIVPLIKGFEYLFLSQIIISLYFISILLGTLYAWPNMKEFDLKIKPSYLVVLSVLLALPLIKLFLSVPFNFFGFRQFYTLSISGSYAGFAEMLSLFLTFIFVYSLFNGKQKYMLLSVAFLLLFGRKTLFLNLMVVSIVYLEQVKRKQILPVVLSVFLFCFFLIFLNYVLVPWDSDDNAFLLALNYFDYHLNLDYLIRNLYINQKVDFFNGHVFLSSFYYYIPRFLWLDKPLVYGRTLIHQAIFPQELSEGYTPSFYEPIAMPLADFGLMRKSPWMKITHLSN